MFKKIDDISVDPTDPFKNDILKREPYATALTNLISTVSQPMVLSVNGPWGTGKTTFLEMWEAKLKTEGFPCVFFNAWQNDFSEEPFISFVLEIEEAISGLNLIGTQKKETTRTLKDLKSGTAKLLKYALPLAVRLASQGFINVDTETDKAIDKTLEKAAKDKLDQYGKMKDSITSFKEKLTTLSTQLQKEEGSKPIIFFVDELDRCRPSYAIKLLENIKHLFNTNGYIFVLGIDREQLGHTVRSVYGQGMNADGYLKRFIDVEYPLPIPATENYVSSLIKSFNLHEDIFNKRRDGGFELSDLKTTFIALSRIFKLSLRVQNQCMAQLNIICRMIPAENCMYECLLTFWIIIKNIDSYAYNSARLDKAYENLIPLVESSSNSEEFRETNHWFFIKAGLIYSQNWSKRGKEVEKIISQFVERINAETTSEKEKNEFRQLVDLLSDYNDFGQHQMCKYLIDCIDLAEINPR